MTPTPPSAPPRPVPLVLIGFGRVGQAFSRLLFEKAETCRRRYHLDPFLHAVLNSRGGFATGRPLRPNDLFAGDAPFVEGNHAWQPGLSLDAVLASAPSPGVVVECAPSDLRTGAPGLAYLRAALDAGWHAAAASKGALVVDFRGLRARAAARGLSLKLGGATAAALPTIDVGTTALAGAEVLAIEGILNGTTNFILSGMAAGRPYAEVLDEARRRGIAEPNPSQDVEGWDTAAKILLLANAVVGLDASLADVSVRGITAVEARDVAGARERGFAVRLVGRCARPAPGAPWALSVAPEALPADHPLASVSGTAKGVTFHTDTMGAITVTGGGSSPRATGAALLKDIVNIYSARR